MHEQHSSCGVHCFACVVELRQLCNDSCGIRGTNLRNCHFAFECAFPLLCMWGRLQEQWTKGRRMEMRVTQRRVVTGAKSLIVFFRAPEYMRRGMGGGRDRKEM